MGFTWSRFVGQERHLPLFSYSFDPVTQSKWCTVKAKTLHRESKNRKIFPLLVGLHKLHSIVKSVIIFTRGHKIITVTYLYSLFQSRHSQWSCLIIRIVKKVTLHSMCFLLGIYIYSCSWPTMCVVSLSLDRLMMRTKLCSILWTALGHLWRAQQGLYLL